MVDSGKASDISVSSWPMEPIPWTPFPILHHLSRQRPVSAVGSSFELLLAGPGVAAGVHPASVLAGVTAGRQPRGSAGSYQLPPREQSRGPRPRSITCSITLSAAQSQAASLLLRGDGAGQSREELDSLKATD